MYFNEFDPFASQWLKNLYPGALVDSRSVKDVAGSDVSGFRRCHFFGGIGGWEYALQLAGWPEDRPVWTGSCPCQPFSSAGKQKGKEDERHLWPEMFRLIRECHPDTIFGEQVSSAIGHGWLDGVFADLEAEGYTCGAIVLGAHSVGSPHIRQRLYWVAQSDAERHDWRESSASTQKSKESIEVETGGANGGVAHSAKSRPQECDIPESSIPESCENNADGWMAISDGTEFQRIASTGEQQVLECSEGFGWKPVVFACECDEDGNCPRCGIDYSECGCPVPTQDGYEYEERDGVMFARRMVQSFQSRLEGHSGNGDGGHESGRIASQESRSASEAGPTDFWSEFRIVQCTDGKARRTGRRIFPLVNGIPRDMGRGQPELGKLARNARGNRVGRLKGYGNAIVPQVAAEFIKAFLERIEVSQ
ncbi:MAG: DNA cytosine methyltransferase [Spirochaetes bacterium]|nr:MAG: DNA cytosine methyltransferase [Spirochaetota bacterium]